MSYVISAVKTLFNVSLPFTITRVLDKTKQFQQTWTTFLLFVVILYFPCIFLTIAAFLVVKFYYVTFDYALYHTPRSLCLSACLLSPWFNPSLFSLCHNLLESRPVYLHTGIIAHSMNSYFNTFLYSAERCRIFIPVRKRPYLSYFL